VAAAALGARFPPIALPLRPPLEPMEPFPADTLPVRDGWQFEPKWDGFRCLAFRRDAEVLLQSKSGQRLDRYFPELVEALRALPQQCFVLDGEIVIEDAGMLSFEQLLLRLHPADSRVRRLAAETPATLVAFDLLVDERGRVLTAEPLHARRLRLEGLVARAGRVGRLRLSPATADRPVAERWMATLVGRGLDGVVAKRVDTGYRPGERQAMVKVKPSRTADCVVAACRYDPSHRAVASLLLGLYDAGGLLDHVGFCAGFSGSDRAALRDLVEPLQCGSGFTGHAPGSAKGWNRRASNQFEPLWPELVCEVAFDHFSCGRFRHGTTFLRWRPDKRPAACTFEQVVTSRWQGGLDRLLAAASGR